MTQGAAWREALLQKLLVTWSPFAQARVEDIAQTITQDVEG